MKRMKTAVLILGVFTIFTLLLTSCATTPTPTAVPRTYYVVEVDSIALPDADLGNKTYILSSAIKSVSDDDIQFKEFARYIEKALSKTGYKRVDSENANLIIRFAYGIGQPKTETNTETYTTSTGYSYQVGWTWINVPPQTETVTTKNTTYERFLMIEAYDSKDRRSQLWRTTVKSKGWSSDLRVALPHMIAAAIYNFGTDTRGKLKTGMYGNAPQVLDIMRSSDAHSVGPGHFAGKVLFGVRLTQLAYEEQLDYNGQRAGVLITEVADNSVAQEMGLQKYDIILALNNHPVDKPILVFAGLRQIREKREGWGRSGELRLTFFSWNKMQEVTATGYLK